MNRRRLERTGAIARGARSAGATAVELGFPFSDPVADGPMLAAAAARSLAAGTTWNDLLIAGRRASRELPTAVMTYANPIYRRGIARACRELARSGVTGLVVPDLDLEDSAPWSAAAERAGVSLVQFASPASSDRRVGTLARSASGFLYVVARYGITGIGGGVPLWAEVRRVVRTAHRTRPDLPVLVGFGVHTASDARRWVGLGADGVIVGTAFETAIGSRGSAADGGRCLARIARGLTAPPAARGGGERIGSR